MKRAACLVGNSSSFIRDASFLGTPVVLVGSRQNGRERSRSVVQVEAVKSEILNAIEAQIKHGPYEPAPIYGAPGVSQSLVSRILQLEPYTQKRLSYVEG
jgi:UDP-N-acetylglucosamine 2-epimerase